MECNLADLYECVANAVGERTAVVEGGRRRTYKELLARTTGLAHGLATRGVARGEHVGLCLRNTVEHLEAMLACYQLGAVPINVNWRYSADELAYLCGDADVVLVIHGDEFADAVAAAAAQTSVGLGTLAAPSAEFEALVRTEGDASGFAGRSGDDRYILYTGGTTGRPKGVVWRQEDIFFAALGGGNPGGPPITRPEEIGVNVVANPGQRITPFLGPDEPAPDRFVAFPMGPLMHASGSWGALGTLLGGGTLVLDAEPHLQPERVLDLVEREQVGLLTLVGDAGGRPLVEALERAPDRWNHSSLRVLGSGGSMLSAEVKARLLAALPSVLAILEGMGSSESPAQAVAVSTRAGGVAPSLTFAAKAETIVVDDELRSIPPGRGIVGRLATRGRVPLGYYRDDERSARTFVTIDGARYSLPGDRAVVDADGTVHLVGRGATCINTGGEKVYPEEVEAALLTHPRVRDAIVVGIPDERYGAAVAAVVACDGEPVELDEIRAHCRAALAGYKLPRALTVVETVRRSPAGKPDHAWAASVAAGS